jgi:hypothetical protein
MNAVSAVWDGPPYLLLTKRRAPLRHGNHATAEIIVYLILLFDLKRQFFAVRSRPMSRFDEIADTLKQRDFIVSRQASDPKNLGNSTMIAGRLNLVIRVIGEGGNILLDMMPLHRFKTPSTESDWFSWDIVARALDIATAAKAGPVRSFLENFYMVDQAFAPQNWAKTETLLSAAKEDGQRSPSKKKH